VHAAAPVLPHLLLPVCYMPLLQDAADVQHTASIAQQLLWPKATRAPSLCCQRLPSSFTVLPHCTASRGTSVLPCFIVPHLPHCAASYSCPCGASWYCRCLVCRQYTRSYLHHVVTRGVASAAILVTYHNVAYMQVGNAVLCFFNRMQLVAISALSECVRAADSLQERCPPAYFACGSRLAATHTPCPADCMVGA
jgi:hypothetical protein